MRSFFLALCIVKSGTLGFNTVSPTTAGNGSTHSERHSFFVAKCRYLLISCKYFAFFLMETYFIGQVLCILHLLEDQQLFLMCGTKLDEPGRTVFYVILLTSFPFVFDCSIRDFLVIASLAFFCFVLLESSQISVAMTCPKCTHMVDCNALHVRPVSTSTSPHRWCYSHSTHSSGNSLNKTDSSEVSFWRETLSREKKKWRSVLPKTKTGFCSQINWGRTPGHVPFATCFLPWWSLL